jgi:hypothetical protein
MAPILRGGVPPQVWFLEGTTKPQVRRDSDGAPCHISITVPTPELAPMVEASPTCITAITISSLNSTEVVLPTEDGFHHHTTSTNDPPSAEPSHDPYFGRVAWSTTIVIVGVVAIYLAVTYYISYWRGKKGERLERQRDAARNRLSQASQQGDGPPPGGGDGPSRDPDNNGNNHSNSAENQGTPPPPNEADPEPDSDTEDLNNLRPTNSTGPLDNGTAVTLHAADSHDTASDEVSERDRGRSCGFLQVSIVGSLTKCREKMGTLWSSVATPSTIWNWKRKRGFSPRINVRSSHGSTPGTVDSHISEAFSPFSSGTDSADSNKPTLSPKTSTPKPTAAAAASDDTTVAQSPPTRNEVSKSLASVFESADEQSHDPKSSPRDASSTRGNPPAPHYATTTGSASASDSPTVIRRTRRHAFSASNIEDANVSREVGQSKSRALCPLPRACRPSTPPSPVSQAPAQPPSDSIPINPFRDPIEIDSGLKIEPIHNGRRTIMRSTVGTRDSGIYMDAEKLKKENQNRRTEGSEDSVSSGAIADDEDWHPDWMKGNAKVALKGGGKSSDDESVVSKAMGKENSPARIP